MDREVDLFTTIKSRSDNILLVVIIFVCIAVTVYVNLVMGTEVVYTHLFYIPIILAGIWYYRKAVYLALFLGLAHIFIGYIDAGHIVPDTFVRAIIFVTVAFVVGYLSENKDRLYNSIRMLLESTDEGIYGVDAQGRCTFINKSALQMLGYSREEIKGKNMHDLIHHTTKDGRRCNLDECCVARSLSAGVGCRNGDDIFWKKDGTSFPVEYSTNPIIEKDKATGAVVTFADITERKKAVDEILDARLQAEFYIDLMSHDINNMNQTGIGYLEMSLEMLKLDDEERKYLEKPLEALCNSSRLIDTVRKLQMVKEGKVKHEKIDLCRMIHEAVSQCSCVTDREMAIRIKADGECYVRADDLLRDVFQNIIGNAIKHSSGSLAIDVELSEVLEDNRMYHRIDISDNGPGIPDELKKKLFTRFQRGATKATGRGLGLYLVRTLVEDFNGRIWVEDRMHGDYEKGSKFAIMLPKA